MANYMDWQGLGDYQQRMADYNTISPGRAMGSLATNSAMNYGPTIQGAMGQIGSTLQGNANRATQSAMAQVPLQMEQLRQSGATNRLGMVAPLLQAMFGGGNRQPAGFVTNFGQMAIPGGGGGGGSGSSARGAPGGLGSHYSHDYSVQTGLLADRIAALRAAGQGNVATAGRGVHPYGT
jgi:hypothetical protein